VCLRCHPDRAGAAEHIIGIGPGAKAGGGLPLPQGVIACSTCHAAHTATPGMLRLPEKDLCVVCHKN